MDSGNPLVLEDKVQIGIYSHIAMSEEYMLFIFTRVYNCKDWIKNTINEFNENKSNFIQQKDTIIDKVST